MRKPRQGLRYTLAAAAVLISFGLAACEEKGPAEKAGEAIDESIEETGDAIEKATD